MHCTFCGTPLPDGSRFCLACGQDLFATTPMRRLATGQASEADLVREALSGEYEEFHELGRGGMALVYRARERALERDVAIKVLPASFTFDQEFVERFQREARTAARLEHPNIIPIYRVGRAGQVIYFVMKYVRGGTLSELLKRHGRLRPGEIRRMLIEAGAALGYAAHHGVVHRDIKPDNIMLDEFGRAVLADFGIAKAATKQKLTGTGLSIGTPRYMSPEQARAQETDGRSDIYSLGIVAYQCLTGSVPFDGDDGFQIGYKHVSEPLPRPVLANDDERALYAVIEKMLAKNPDDRFQVASEVEQALTGQKLAPSIVRAMPQDGAPVVLMPGDSNVRSGLSPTVAAPARVPPPEDAHPAPSEPAVTPPGARRVANRSAAMKRGRGPVWPVVVLVLAVMLGAGFWLWKRGQPVAAPASAVAADSGKVAAVATDSPLAATADSSRPAPAQAPTAAPVAAVAPVRDSGAIRIRNLPAGSEVLIDEQRAMSPVTLVAVGSHVVAVSAPMRRFYAETVSVRRNDTLLLAPKLAPLGAPEPRAPAPALAPAKPVASAGKAGEVAQPASKDPCEPGPQWDGTKCFDIRPRPLAAPFVPLPAGVKSVARPAEFWVFVGLSGASEEARLLRSSGNAAFDKAARAVAQALEWAPAQKAGEPVSAWTQLVFPPRQ